MRVLVDGLPLRHGGGVTHLENELSALARVDPGIECHTLLSPWSSVTGLPGGVETVRLRSVAHRFAYEQARIPFRKADLLYCPANFGPFISKLPMVLTIQNANYYGAGLYQRETKPSRPVWKVKSNHLAMRRADTIIAISQSLADQACMTVSGIEHKMHVVYHGAPEWPATVEPVEHLPELYALSVGSGAPHKHVGDVVAGWVLSRQMSQTSVSLVLVGAFTAAQRVEHRKIAGKYERDVVHLGTIESRAALHWIYTHALVMIVMSTLESFSLTTIEAGSVGCPLILSDIPVHREVVGSNAVLIPPRNVRRLGEALALDAYEGSPASRPWSWPVTWDEHAQEISVLLRSSAAQAKG
jgi:glycosyltransferase involved in cell wall biosynthesis